MLHLKLSERDARRALIDTAHVARLAHISRKLDLFSPQAIRNELVVHWANVMNFKRAHPKHLTTAQHVVTTWRKADLDDDEANRLRILWLCAVRYIDRIDRTA